MDVAQYILCFVARYVNVSYSKGSVTMFSTSCAFEMHISYRTHGAYPKYDFLRNFALCPKFIFGSPNRTKRAPNVRHARRVRQVCW